MEKENVIDRTKEEYMKMPSISKFIYASPLKMQPFKLKPLQSIQPNSALSLPLEILEKIGYKPEEKTMFDGLLGCNTCGACKTLSKSTLNQLTDDPQSMETLSTRSKRRTKTVNEHLNDTNKRDTFEKEWKQVKKYSVRVPRVSFQKFYQQKGHLDVQKWKEEVRALYG